MSASMKTPFIVTILPRPSELDWYYGWMACSLLQPQQECGRSGMVQEVMAVELFEEIYFSSIKHHFHFTPNQHDTLSRLAPWRHGSQTITAWARTSESMRQRQKKPPDQCKLTDFEVSNWFRLKLQIQRERTSHQSTRWICQQTSEAASWQQHLQPIHLQHAVLNFTTCVLLFLS